MAEKWKGFGWNVIELNGHDHEALRAALQPSGDPRPTVIVAHTVKGHRIPFMERDILWHYRFPHDGWEYDGAVSALHACKPEGVEDPYTPNGIDNVSLVVHSDALSNKLYAVLSEVQQELQPDKLQVVDGIAMVAIVGRHMASQPGSSGKIFSALGQAGVNIRMINQGPDELNIIFGVDNDDFKEAIRVLYNSFVK